MKKQYRLESWLPTRLRCASSLVCQRWIHRADVSTDTSRSRFHGSDTTRLEPTPDVDVPFSQPGRVRGAVPAGELGRTTPLPPPPQFHFLCPRRAEGMVARGVLVKRHEWVLEAMLVGLMLAVAGCIDDNPQPRGSRPSR